MSDKEQDPYKPRKSNRDPNGNGKDNAASVMESVAAASGVNRLGRGRGRHSVREDGGNEDTTSDSDMGRRESKAQKREGNGERKDASKRGRSRDGRVLSDISTLKFKTNTKPSSVLSKKGNTGEPVKLITNHFMIKLGTDFEFRHYRVDFLPELDNLKIRKALINQQAETLGAFIYDGANIIYLVQPLPNMDLPCRTREGTDYLIKIVNTGLTINLVTEALGDVVFNTMLRRALNGLEMQEVQRNFYDEKNKIDLREYKIQLWPGYITSIRQHEDNILVCCEISHKVMREETCFDVLKDKIYDAGRFGGDHKEAFEKEVVGTVVLTAYNNSTYSIAGVEWKESPESTFETKNGQVSFLKYYKDRYNLTIRDRRQPLLIAKLNARDIRGGRTKPALLVPELCRTTGLTDSMRSNFQMMKVLGEYTRMDPTRRYQRLLDFSKRIRTTPASNEVLRKFNVAISPNMERVFGRVLPIEQLIFGNNKLADYDQKTADWTPAIRSNQMYATVICTKWIIFTPAKLARDTENFLRLMMEVAEGFRYDMARPKIVELPDDRVASYQREISQIIPKSPNLIMCIFMGNAPTNAVRYATIKKLTTINSAIPTQCLLSKTMTPKKGAQMNSLKSVATKVVMQINCKLGGAIWMIKMPVAGLMTCGFDVSHSTAKKSQSYGAFVASMDLQKSVKFFSSVMAHENGVECSKNMIVQMIKALNAFFIKHNALPQRILFYRDGVGDGDIDYVVKQEIIYIEKCIKDCYEGRATQLPKFCFIIVSKRINTRFFAENTAGSGHVNPIPGTVVDDVVTLPLRYDFFLVSQSVRQGTVSPTSYNIIRDTFGLTTDRLQQLTYKMTHLYYNWCGTTRVPATVQYAHKLSILVAQFTHQVPNDALNTKLYFL